MLELMNRITDKLDWFLKVSSVVACVASCYKCQSIFQIFDESITSTWRAAALGAKEHDVTEKMIDWCIAELQFKAKIFRETGAVSVFRGEVIKSDVVISIPLQDELKRAVAPLENVPAQYKDWHPGSNEQVLDLVHPSLFPLVYGKSRILPDSLTTLNDFVERCGEGNIVPVPPEEEAKLESQSWGGLELQDPFSRRFQWLPCEVDISSDDGSVR